MCLPFLTKAKSKNLKRWARVEWLGTLILLASRQDKKKTKKKKDKTEDKTEDAPAAEVEEAAPKKRTGNVLALFNQSQIQEFKEVRDRALTLCFSLSIAFGPQLTGKEREEVEKKEGENRRAER